MPVYLQCQWLWNAMRLRPQGVQDVSGIMHTFLTVLGQGDKIEVSKT